MLQRSLHVDTSERGTPTIVVREALASVVRVPMAIGTEPDVRNDGGKEHPHAEHLQHAGTGQSAAVRCRSAHVRVERRHSEDAIADSLDLTAIHEAREAATGETERLQMRSAGETAETSDGVLC